MSKALGPRGEEWRIPRSYIVPKDISYRLPQHLRWSGPQVRGCVGTTGAAFIVSPSLWAYDVQAHMSGVVVVAAVQATFVPEGGGLWGVSMTLGDWRLRTGVPRWITLPTQGRLRISTASMRSGEVLCRPVRDAGSDE